MTVDLTAPLLERLRGMRVIDAHAHLMPEERQLRQHKDALSVYGQYVRLPMLASGLSYMDWRKVQDPSVPLKERWSLLKTPLANVRHTSFAQAARITLQHYCGVAELTDANLEEASARIAANHRPGLYHRVLREHCGIQTVVNQNTLPDTANSLDVYRNQELLAPVVALIEVAGDEGIDVSLDFPDLDAYLEWGKARIERLFREGAVGFKSFSIGEVAVDRALAQEQYQALRLAGKPLRMDDACALRTYIHHAFLETVQRWGAPVAVHTGFWDVTTYHPVHFIPVLQRFPGIHFDLFHAGIPYAREIGAMAVNYPNTTLNLCWAHSNNASLMRAALEEYIDWLGMDKIIAFGSDVHQNVEKVYGHLEVARRNIAIVLARRIADGWMDLDAAVELAQAWFFDNPRRVYKLPAGCD